MRVIATAMSMRLGIPISELGRIANPGEEFEVTNVRFKYLSGDNKDHIVFVKEAPEVTPASVKLENTEVVVDEVEEPKPKRAKKNGTD